MRENKESLGMLYLKTRKDGKGSFLSGYIELEKGERKQIVVNKAKTLTKNGEEFFVIFENTFVPAGAEGGAPAAKVVTKAKVMDEDAPF